MPPSYVITDVGSTTTKAIWYRGSDGARLVGRAEAPTTVEKPFEDVTVGVMSAPQARGGRRTRAGLGGLQGAGEGTRRQYRYLSTSSAGGAFRSLSLGSPRA